MENTFEIEHGAIDSTGGTSDGSSAGDTSDGNVGANKDETIVTNFGAVSSAATAPFKITVGAMVLGLCVAVL